MATAEQLIEEQNILAEAKRGMRKEKVKDILSGIKKGATRTTGILASVVAAPGKPVNVSTLQRAPQTILSKEQAMLNGLFGQKNQLWGGNNPVTINNTLTSGFGLINTGSGNMTRRLFLP